MGPHVLRYQSAIASVLYLIMAGAPITAPAQATWQSEPPPNEARNQFAGAVVNGKLLIFGGNGYPDGRNLKSTEMFDPVSGVWAYRADNEHNGGNGVEEVSGAAVKGKFFVFGGYGGGNPYGVFNFVEAYNPKNNVWRSMAPMPTTRSAATAVSYKNKVYVFGGQDLEPFDVVEAYDPATDTWQAVTHMPRVLASPAIAVVGDMAYVIGGGDPSTYTAVSDVYAYNFETGIWTTGFTELPVARVFSFGSAAPVFGGKIYLVGGAKVTDMNLVPSTRVDIYDPAANKWKKGPALPVPAFGFGSGFAAIANDKLYAIYEADVSIATAVSEMWSLDLKP